ncbi:MAG: hypothetical protein AAGI71_16630 [Bacteroidota bacterium]
MVPRLDIVIPTIRDLTFLEAWRPHFAPHRILVVQDGDPARAVHIPDGYDATCYTWDDIERLLGPDRWIISKRDSACRCFGFLMATSRYVYTIDDDCYPATDPSGEAVDPVAQHRHNLEAPSFQRYFNTLYDAEFVRGYPFGLRTGAPTAISHGLWLNVADLDAPTQMVRPLWRNTQYVDIVQSVPRGTLYPMSGMNLAFDQRLIGPAFYFGLMGEGQPLGRYDDLWAGWCAKAICDHLGYGVKSGKPYVWHERASDWRSNFVKEHQGILWQEELVPFFERLTFTGTTATACYRELAQAVRRELPPLDPYFLKLAEAMEVWLHVWHRVKKTQVDAHEAG